VLALFFSVGKCFDVLGRFNVSSPVLMVFHAQVAIIHAINGLPHHFGLLLEVTNALEDGLNSRLNFLIN
jgi:hypothetical protein